MGSQAHWEYYTQGHQLRQVQLTKALMMAQVHSYLPEDSEIWSQHWSHADICPNLKYALICACEREREKRKGEKRQSERENVRTRVEGE